MKSHLKLLLLLLISLAIVQTSCKCLIANQIKDSIELEVKRDYSAEYEVDSISGYKFVDNGLGMLFQQMDSAATLNIVLTHGLGRTKDHHFDMFKKMLVKGLSYKKDHPDTPMERLIHSECDTSFVTGMPKIYKSTYPVSDKKICIYEVHWSPITIKAKDIVIGLDRSEFRSVLTQRAKDSLLVDVFGDLALYQNPEFAPCINKPLNELISQLNKPSASNDSIVLIGGSFGNELFLKALASMPDDEKGSFLGETNKLARIYMLSNQLPFTAFLSMQGTMENSKEAFLRHIYKDLENLKGKYLPIISFYDPNDVFGYALPETNLSEHHHLVIQNVQVKNTMEWSFNPDKVREKYLGSIKNPKMRATVKGLLYQDTSRQNIKIDLTGPNVAAKENLAVIGVIVKGRGYTETKFDSSFYLVKHGSTYPDSINSKLDSVEEIRNPKDTIKIKFEKNGCYILKRLSRYIIAKKMDQMGISDAPMPFEFPSKDFQKDSNAIQGMQQNIQANQVTNIVTLHGMRSKGLDHFDDLMYGLVRQLGFIETPTRDTILKVKNGSTPDNFVGGQTSIHFKEFTNVYGKKLRFLILYWSSLTAPAKKLLQDMDAKSLKGADKSFINELFKQQLINDGLTDVLLTTNEFDIDIEKLLDTAFRFLNQNQAPNPSTKDTYLVTGSLGSQLMMDYLKRNINSNVVKSLLRRTAYFYMLTNQLPFLNLKHLESDTEDSSAFINQIYGDLVKQDLKIIAFNDPNDVLGFALPTPRKGSALNVINISLNIAEGISLRKYQTLKTTKYVDKIFKKMIKRKMLKKQRKIVEEEVAATNDKEDKEGRKFWEDQIIKEMKLHKKDHKKFVSSKFLSLLDNSVNPKQTFVVRIDTAHEAQSEDKRILKIMAFGTGSLPKSSRKEPEPPASSR